MNKNLMPHEIKLSDSFINEDDFSKKFDVAVMDVSFISQTFIHKGISSVLNDNGILISLIKPQFECGRAALNSHGIVKNKTDHVRSINKIIDSAIISGFSCMDVVRSPIVGGSGNIEYLIYLIKSSTPTNFIPDSKIKQTTL